VAAADRPVGHRWWLGTGRVRGLPGGRAPETDWWSRAPRAAVGAGAGVGPAARSMAWCRTRVPAVVYRWDCPDRFRFEFTFRRLVGAQPTAGRAIHRARLDARCGVDGEMVVTVPVRMVADLAAQRLDGTTWPAGHRRAGQGRWPNGRGIESVLAPHAAGYGCPPRGGGLVANLLAGPDGFRDGQRACGGCFHIDRPAFGAALTDRLKAWRPVGLFRSVAVAAPVAYDRCWRGCFRDPWPVGCSRPYLDDRATTADCADTPRYPTSPRP